MKLPYGSHACLSKYKGGTSTPDKSQTRRAPASPKVPILPRTGNILHMGETPRQSRDFPHLMQSHAQFANRGEDGPCSWAVQLKDGVEVRYTHLNTVTGRPDSLVESQPLQILFKMGKDM